MRNDVMLEELEVINAFFGDRRVRAGVSRVYISEAELKAGRAVCRLIEATRSLIPHGETVPTLPNSFYRTLSASEETEFRQWARDNWKPGMRKLTASWHPIIRDECRAIEEEARRSDASGNNEGSIDR